MLSYPSLACGQPARMGTLQGRCPHRSLEDRVRLQGANARRGYFACVQVQRTTIGDEHGERRIFP